VPGDPSEFYVPMAAQSQFLYRPITENFHWFVRLMARLRPGVSDAQLRATLDVAFAREASVIMKEPRMLMEPGRAGLAIDRNNYRKPLLLMLGVVGLVMLVACANLAGLSLARGAAREHELAVRAALGAGRWRLIRQSLTESLVLALLGGGLGVLVAVWGKTAISRLLAGSADGLHYDFSLDLTVLSFSLATALVTALLSGLLPALRAGRVDPLDGLKSRGALGAPRLRTGKVLVAAQVCLSLLLLTDAGLYVRTLVNLTHIDAGFSTERLLLFQLNPGGAGYDDPAQRATFYGQVQDSLSTVPGVRGATFLGNPLLDNSGWSGAFFFPDRFADYRENMQSYRLTVGETFFATMGIPVLQGRGLSAADAEGAPEVVVVNETFAREYSPDKNPLGRTVHILMDDWRIVGVCRDAKYLNVKEAAPPTVYFPFRQISYMPSMRNNYRSAYFALRTALPPMALTTAARKAVAAIDPNVPLANITTQEAVRDKNINQERLFATLCGALAGLALLLSCIGLYGLMAYHVARRTSEFAIRMALGATRRNIADPILREALLLAAFGVAIGVPVALALARFIKSQLYGVAPTDPVTLIGAGVLLIAVAVLAAWIPARRAAKVDPMAALRCE
jgi:predicted permease